MQNIQVGFITPNNQKIYMEYSEVEGFCRQLCYQSENYQNFLEFQKQYTYFTPFFDFVMFHLNYIFMNPLLQENTYLKNVSNSLYLVKLEELETESYNSITERAITIKNGKTYSHIVACSDVELNIQYYNGTLYDCLIDPNGYSMMSKKDEEKGNHEITGNTILNQLLIYNSSLVKYLDNRKYSPTLLSMYFGFLYINARDKIIIGVDRFLSPIVKKMKDDHCSKDNGIFYDWENDGKLIEQTENYKIR